MSVPLRSLSTSEVLDRTFSLYRQHFVLFAGIAGLAQLLIMASQLTPAMFVAFMPLLGSNSAEWAIALPLVGALLFLIVMLWAYAFSHAATLMAVSNIYLDRPTSIRDAYRQVKGRVRNVLATSFNVGFLSMLGLMLLVVPGILLWLRWALAVPVAALEEASPRQAMDRSKFLTEGRRGDIFVVYFLFLILSWVIVGVFTFPVGVLIATHAKTGIPIWMQVVQHLTAFVGGTLVAPFLTIAMAVVYFDQRVRKEAFDLQMMVAALDGAPPMAAGQAAASII
jgi:Membrane domain of glycerophosphoryl diester phosphodiesterase